MNINRTNYESYFLLYVDRELTVVERQAVEEFVANNPDLQTELELLQASCLPAETVSFLKKPDLYKTTELSSELKESALLYTDNELTETERTTLEARLIQEPALGQLVKELAQTKLNPAERVAFPDKTTLYRREPARVVSFYFRRIAAAAAVIGIGLFITVTVVRNQANEPEKGMAVNNDKTGSNEKVNRVTLPTPFENNAEVPNKALNQNGIDPTVAPDNNSTDLSQANNPTGTDNRKRRSTASPAPLYTHPMAPTGNEKGSLAQEKKQRSGITEKNTLPLLAPEKNIPLNRNETIASNVPISNTPDPNKLIAQLSPERDQPANPTAPASGSGKLTALDTDITPALANADARTAGLRTENDPGSNDQYLGMDESRIKKSKLTGFLRKVKRVVERNTRIKEGSNVSIAGFAIAVK